MAALSDTERQAHSYETSVVESALLAATGETEKSTIISAAQAARDRSAAYLTEGRACVAGEVVASVGAWVKLCKSGWPKPKKSIDGATDNVKMEQEGDDGPPTKRFKEESA